MKNFIKAEGIMCKNCVRKVTNALTDIGAEAVSVSDDFKTVTVEHNGIDADKLTAAIEAIDNGKFKVLEVK